jgi:hypothetical protein
MNIVEKIMALSKEGFVFSFQHNDGKYKFSVKKVLSNGVEIGEMCDFEKTDDANRSIEKPLLRIIKREEWELKIICNENINSGTQL